MRTDARVTTTEGTVAAIEDGTWVRLQYRLFDAQGEAIEPDARELEYLHGGYGAVLPALERALAGRAAGERLTVHVEPEDAFGDYDAELVEMVPRHALPDALEAGMTFEGLPGEPQDGPGRRLWTVTDFTDEQVILDGNHPLAGLALRYEITVLALRPAEPEEIEAERRAAGLDAD